MPTVRRVNKVQQVRRDRRAIRVPTVRRVNKVAAGPQGPQGDPGEDGADGGTLAAIRFVKLIQDGDAEAPIKYEAPGFSNTTTTAIFVGETTTLAGKAISQDENPIDVEFEWVSSNEGVAMVDVEAGVATSYRLEPGGSHHNRHRRWSGH